MQVGKKRVGDEGIEQAGNYPPSNALSHPLGNGTCSSIIINTPIVNYYSQKPTNSPTCFSDRVIGVSKTVQVTTSL